MRETGPVAMSGGGPVTSESVTSEPVAPEPVTSEPVLAAPVPPRPAAKRKRGRESVGDMVRSLALVLLVVLVIWFFGSKPWSNDEAAIRTVDPTGDVASFTGQYPGALVPRNLPAGWRSTSSNLAGTPEVLRIGYNTPLKQYAEYDGVIRPDAKTLQQLTGSDRALGPVQIGGVSWQRYQDGDGSLSFVREAGRVTVVVGSTRASAGEAELRVLLGALSGG